MKWVKLHEITDNEPLEIHVNLELVSSIQDAANGQYTEVWVSAGHFPGKIKVVQTSTEIFKLAGLLRVT